MDAHAQGIWEVSPLSDTMVQEVATKRAVAATSVYMSSEDVEGCHGLNVAHALLIAAAPELLDLLYRWQASGCPHCPGDCAGANPPSATCIVRATAAAIAKATGK